MKNLLWKYPLIYLLLFSAGSLLFGFEIADVYKNGFPEDQFGFFLEIATLVFYLALSLYFFFSYLRVKKLKLDSN
jgi:hypothetical protein